MAKYLTLSGLEHFVSNIKTFIKEQMGNGSGGGSSSPEDIFELKNGQVMVTKNSDGTTQSVVEENEHGVLTTTFIEEDGLKTITTEIVPSSGDYNYTQTVTRLSDSSGTLLTESYIKTNK